MTAVDFTAWASPTLDLTLGGRTYCVRPPSVAGSRAILAITVREELRLGLAKGEMPADLQALLDEIAQRPFEPLVLGQDVYDRMVADEVAQTDVTRMAYYALHYWARGKARADSLTEALWGNGSGGESSGPKGRRRSRSGPRTA